MRPIATDSADFQKLRENGCIYVDKTRFMHRMVSTVGTNLFFISRPRRFGKSLTISALKALFSGRRELFKGLYIDGTDWKWERHPIIHFSFNTVSTASYERFDSDFSRVVKTALADAGFKCGKKSNCALDFGDAIEALSAKSRGRGVVILIDEYDAPVGHCLDDIDKAEAVRDRLAELYSQMKDRTGDIRFLFMTGVSKFTRLSVFSALSNLVDVSQDDEYATMFGYTEEELTANFEEHLRAHAEKIGKPYGDYREEMKRWYNGFRFARNDPTTVYNPVSVALTLFKMEPGFSATWATTGRPSMLMRYLKREDMLAVNPDKVEDVDASEFDVAELRNLKPVAMLFQSGYLTVKDYSTVTESYTLGVPDEEVRRDLCSLMTGVAADETVAWAGSLGKKLLNAKWEAVFAGLKSLYAHLPYGPKEGEVQEFSYERVLYVLFASQGIEVVAEDRQSNGRTDVVVKHPAIVCIFELKVDEPVDKAFRQIHEKGYADPYRADPRPVWLVGLSFDSKTRKLVDCAAERFMV